MGEPVFAYYFDFDESAADNGAYFDAVCVGNEAEALTNLLKGTNDLGRHAEQLLSHTDSVRRVVLKRLSQADSNQETMQ